MYTFKTLSQNDQQENNQSGINDQKQKINSKIFDFVDLDLDDLLLIQCDINNIVTQKRLDKQQKDQFENTVKLERDRLKRLMDAKLEKEKKKMRKELREQITHELTEKQEESEENEEDEEEEDNDHEEIDGIIYNKKNPKGKILRSKRNTNSAFGKKYF
jgi:hypothetical protein